MLRPSQNTIARMRREIPPIIRQIRKDYPGVTKEGVIDAFKDSISKAGRHLTGEAAIIVPSVFVAELRILVDEEFKQTEPTP